LKPVRLFSGDRIKSTLLFLLPAGMILTTGMKNDERREAMASSLAFALGEDFLGSA